MRETIAGPYERGKAPNLKPGPLELAIPIGRKTLQSTRFDKG